MDPSQRDLLALLLALRDGHIRNHVLVATLEGWSEESNLSFLETVARTHGLTAEQRETWLRQAEQWAEDHSASLDDDLAALIHELNVAPQLAKLAPNAQHSLLATLSLRTSATDDGTQSLPQRSATKSTPRPPRGDRFQTQYLHAKGGLGEVFVATDTELNRQVAVKEIQAKYADDEASRARFMVEAEVTGNLEHPGIVPVYSLGQHEDGRPYYAMRLIDGVSLKEAADRFHGKNSGITKLGEENVAARRTFDSLEFRKLLGHFVDVCNAIEYAHSRGVLHRDLKPANIMLGKFGETLVVDWGLAKRLQESPSPRATGEDSSSYSSPYGTQGLETLQGQAIGTPSYMPPEQAAGQLDQLRPASDVYSLGATLYYLLTGKAPFQGGELPQLLEQVQQGKLRAPASIRADVPESLQAICLKAMSREPKDRYSEAQSLANDVERYLADEPVVAKRDSVFKRTKRWIRKHQTIAATTLGVAIVTLLALGIAVPLLMNKNWELEVANENEAQAREQADASASEAIAQSEFAMSTLSAVIHDIQVGLRNVAGGSEIRRRLLETSLERLEALADRSMEKTRYDLNTAVALSEMGHLILEIGSPDTPGSTQNESAQVARKFLRKSLSILDQLITEVPSREVLSRERFRVLLSLGDAEALDANPEKSLEYCREAHLLLERLADPSDREVFQLLLCEGKSLWFTGQLDRCLETFRQASQLVKGSPQSAELINRLGVDYLSFENLYATALQDVGQYQQARDLIASAVTRGTMLREAGNTFAGTRIPMMLQTQAKCEIALGQLDAAIDSVSAALEQIVETRRAELNDHTLRATHADVLLTLGHTYELIAENPSRYENGKGGREACLLEALAFHKQADDLASEGDTSLPGFQYVRAVSLLRTGDILEELRQPDKMRKAYERAFAITNALMSNRLAWPGLADTHSTILQRLCWLERQSGNLESALDFANQLVESKLQVTEKAPHVVGYQYNLVMGYLNRASVLTGLGDLNRATADLEQAQSVSSVMLDKWSDASEAWDAVLHAYRAKADHHLRRGEFQQAIDQSTQLVGKMQKVAEQVPENASLSSRVSDALKDHGKRLDQIGRPDQAFRSYQQRLSIDLRTLEQTPNSVQAIRRVMNSRNFLGDRFLRLGKPSEAQHEYEQLLALAQQTVRLAPEDQQSKRDLSTAYERLGLLAQQEMDYEHALDCYKKMQVIKAELAAAAPGDEVAQSELAISEGHLGEVHAFLGRMDDARKAFESKLAINQSMLSRDPESLQAFQGLLGAYSQLGDFHTLQGQHEQAVDYFEKRLQVSKRAAAAFPTNATFQLELVKAHGQLAITLVRTKQPNKAADEFQSALALAETLRSQGLFQQMLDRLINFIEAELTKLEESERLKM